MGGEHGLNQDLVLRLPMPSVGNISIPSESNIAEEENKELRKEESEIREDLPKDNDCDHMERYVKNYNDQSPSSRFSVFSRPLLLGDFSGLGGISGYEDLELMRKEAENDMAWGMMSVGVIISNGEVDGTEGRTVEETQHESTGELEVRQLRKQFSG